MGKTWGRLYSGTRNHRKIRILRERHPQSWWIWYTLIEMALECDDNGLIYAAPDLPFTESELAKELGLTSKRMLNSTLTTLKSLALVELESGYVRLLSYLDRQFESDISKERTRKYRERLKEKERQSPSPKQSSDVTVTPITEHNITYKKPPIVPHEGDNGFTVFWNSYPKKVGRKAALNAWKKARGKPPLKKIIDALIEQKASVNWLKDDGQYIPNPATWINQGRWDDEVATGQPTSHLCSHGLRPEECKICRDHIPRENKGSRRPN
jgi:hypothetical protein